MIISFFQNLGTFRLALHTFQLRMKELSLGRSLLRKTRLAEVTSASYLALYWLKG